MKMLRTNGIIGEFVCLTRGEMNSIWEAWKSGFPLRKFHRGSNVVNNKHLLIFDLSRFMCLCQCVCPCCLNRFS